MIRFVDPDGLLLELVGSNSLAPVEPWPDSPIPPEHALHGFHSVSALWKVTKRRLVAH